MQVEWSEPLPQQDNLGHFSTVMVSSQLRHRPRDSLSHAGLSCLIVSSHLNQNTIFQAERKLFLNCFIYQSLHISNCLCSQTQGWMMARELEQTTRPT